MDRNNKHVTEIMLLEMSQKPLSRITEAAADAGGAVGAKPIYKFEGPCAEFGVTNENYRKYSKDDYMKKVAELIPKINENDLMGELDHRDEYGVQMKTVSHLITGLRYDESSKQVMIQIELLDTDEGRKVMAIADRKIPIHISSRASGYIDDDGNVELERIYTYDIVSEPGFKNARLKRLNESLHIDSKFVGIYEWKDVKDKGNAKNEAQAQAVDVNNILNIVRKEMASGMGVIKNSITEVKKDIIKMQTSAKHVNIGRIPRAIREDAQETPSASPDKPEQTKDDFVTRMKKIDPAMTEDNSDAQVTMYKNGDGIIIGQWWNDKNKGTAIRQTNDDVNESNNNPVPDISELLGLDDMSLKNAFATLKGTTVVVDIEPLSAETWDFENDSYGAKVVSKVKDLEHDILAKFPGAESVEVNDLSIYEATKVNESVEITDADIDAIEAGLIEEFGDTGKMMHEGDLFNVIPNATPHLGDDANTYIKPIIAALRARGWSVETYESIKQVIDHVNKLGRNFNKLVEEVDGGDVALKAMYEYVDGVGKSVNKAWDYITVQTNTINKLINNQNLSRPKEIREALACIKGLKKISESLVINLDKEYLPFVTGKIKAIKTVDDVSALLDEAADKLSDDDYQDILRDIAENIGKGEDTATNIAAAVKRVGEIAALNGGSVNENADTAKSTLKTAGYISDEEDSDNNDYVIDGNDLICNTDMIAKTLIKHLKKNGHQCDINGNVISLLEARDVEILRLRKIVESISKPKPKKRVNEGHSDIEYLTDKCKEYGLTQEDTDFLIDDCGGDISPEMEAQIKNICLNAKHGGEDILEYFGYDVPDSTYETKIKTGSIVDITEGRLKGKKAIVTNKIIGKNKAFEGIQAKVNGRIINIPASAIKEAKITKPVDEAVYGGNTTADKLEVGKKYRVDSGMGGTFDVKYNGKVGDKHEFENVHPGWEKDKWSDPNNALYHYGDEDIATKIYTNDKVSEAANEEGVFDWANMDYNARFSLAKESFLKNPDKVAVTEIGMLTPVQISAMKDSMRKRGMNESKYKKGQTLSIGAIDDQSTNWASPCKVIIEYVGGDGDSYDLRQLDDDGNPKTGDEFMTTITDGDKGIDELIKENKLNSNTVNNNKYSTQVLSENVDRRIDSLNKQKDEASNAEMVKSYPFLVLVKEDAKVLFGGLPTARKKLIGQTITNSKNKSADFITETIHLIATKNDALLEFESKLSDKQLKIWENVERKVQKQALASYNTREINDGTEMTAFFESLDLRPIKIAAPDEAQPERPINESNYNSELGYNDTDIDMILGLEHDN